MDDTLYLAILLLIDFWVVSIVFKWKHLCVFSRSLFIFLGKINVRGIIGPKMIIFKSDISFFWKSSTSVNFYSQISDPTFSRIGDIFMLSYLYLYEKSWLLILICISFICSEFESFSYSFLLLMWITCLCLWLTEYLGS